MNTFRRKYEFDVSIKHSTGHKNANQPRLLISNAFQYKINGTTLYKLLYLWINKIVGMNLGEQFFTTDQVTMGWMC